MSTDEPATATAPATPPAKQQPASAGKVLLNHAGVVLGAVVIANVLFMFLSDRYFAERAAKHGPQELDGIGNARVSFAMFTISVAIAGIAAMWKPRQAGHLISALGGALLLVAGIAVFQRDLSPVLGVTLLVIGALFPLAAHHAWRGSRAGWAFAVALGGVLGMMSMFAAPTLGRLFGVSLWQTMILPGILGVGTAALLSLRDSYRD